MEASRLKSPKKKDGQQGQNEGQAGAGLVQPSSWEMTVVSYWSAKSTAQMGSYERGSSESDASPMWRIHLTACRPGRGCLTESHMWILAVPAK